MATGEAVERKPALGLFTRSSTGLVREMSLWDAFVVNLIDAGPATNFAIWLLLGIAVFPGASLWLATITGVTLGASLLIIYSLMAGAMPRTGGDYVFVSRILNPAVGFVASWAMMINAAFWPAYSGWAIPNWVLPDIIGPLGVWYNNQTLINIANALPQQGWELGIGLVVLVSYYVVNVAGLRWVIRFQVVAFALMVAAVAVAIPALLFANSSDFASHFNAFASHYGTSASAVVQTAQKSGFTGSQPFSFATTAAVWPFAMFLTGYAITTIPMSGEVRRPGRTQMISTLSSNFVSGILVATLLGLVVLKSDPNIMGAIGYFDFVNGANSPFTFPIYGHVMLGIATGSIFITVLFGAAVLAGQWSTGIVLQTWATRYVFAWSFDRIFPAWFSNIEKRFHSPRNALVLVNVIGLILMLILIYYPTLSVVSTGLLLTAMFVIVSVAAIVVPYRAKLRELFKASPGLSIKILGMPMIAVVGVISLVFQLAMAYYYVTQGAYGATSTVSWQFAGGIVAAGVIYYVLARWQRARQGINLGLTFNEIPPE